MDRLPLALPLLSSPLPPTHSLTHLSPWWTIQVLRLTVERNAELAKLGSEAALSLEEVEAQVVKSLALYAALDFQVRNATLCTE